ncbi:SDR family NAD(P)-dependent oxidoreductase [Thermodesulfobacteriota bacterium]
MKTEKFSLMDKVAVVTGGAMGIGRGVALGFADMGADVVIVDRDDKAAEATVSEIRNKGRKGLVVLSDVRNSESVTTLRDNIVSEFGHIDILVNNAGGMFKADISEISEGGWDAIIRANLKTTFLCSKAVSSVMMEKKTRGGIINIASVNGLSGSPSTAAYGAAKAAVINLTQSLAMELAPYYIRVNAIAPGTIDTPGTSKWMTPEREKIIATDVPLSRRGTPEDIAGAAIYLASDCADYVTGSILVVDGGIMATPRVP